MPKVFSCSSCLTQHARPVGKKCQLKAGESFSSESEVVVPSSTNEITVSDEILNQLRQLGEKMDSMDKRVQRTEAALEKGNSQATDIPAASLGTAGQVTGYDIGENIAQSVVPSLDFLRNNESLQNQVERRLAELKNVNEMATRGRLKSQRGGPGDIAVKKLIDWPQNFILTGAHKTRPTYDDLTITQWVSGFVRCIQEEKSGDNRDLMLDYLGNLMEDASDFSWDSAKAAHAILLTNMEADRVKWSDTEKIDRLHRAHAQRHISHNQASATRSFGKKSKNSGNKTGVNCRFFQEGNCKYPSHHKTAGTFFRHVCENCDGVHITKNCTQKNHTKN